MSRNVTETPRETDPAITGLPITEASDLLVRFCLASPASQDEQYAFRDIDDRLVTGVELNDQNDVGYSRLRVATKRANPFAAARGLEVNRANPPQAGRVLASYQFDGMSWIGHRLYLPRQGGSRHYSPGTQISIVEHTVGDVDDALHTAAVGPDKNWVGFYFGNVVKTVLASLV